MGKQCFFRRATQILGWRRNKNFDSVLTQQSTYFLCIPFSRVYRCTVAIETTNRTDDSPKIARVYRDISLILCAVQIYARREKSQYSVVLRVLVSRKLKSMNANEPGNTFRNIFAQTRVTCHVTLIMIWKNVLLFAREKKEKKKTHTHTHRERAGTGACIKMQLRGTHI